MTLQSKSKKIGHGLKQNSKPGRAVAWRHHTVGDMLILKEKTTPAQYLLRIFKTRKKTTKSLKQLKAILT
jgi:hypothetical protein